MLGHWKRVEDKTGVGVLPDVDYARACPMVSSAGPRTGSSERGGRPNHFAADSRGRTRQDSCRDSRPASTRGCAAKV